MRTVVAALFVSVLLSSGCATNQTKLSIERYELAATTWEGGQLSDMIDAWGIPSEVHDLSELQGPGRKIIVWSKGQPSGHTQVEPASRRTLSCTSETRERGFGADTETECIEGTASAISVEDQSYRNLGLAIGHAMNPPELCKVSVHVRDGVIHRVAVENVGCRLSEPEYAELANPDRAPLGRAN